MIKSTNNLSERLNRAWSRYIFKRRDILGISTTEYDSSWSRPGFPYRLFSYTPLATVDDLPSRTYSELCSIVGSGRVAARFAHPDITLFTAVTDDDELAGFRWALHPYEYNLWHDYVRVRPNDTLIFNSYTAPPHRRRGIFSALIHYGNGQLFNTTETTRILAIVEAQNRASRDALLGQGLQVLGTNFLIKVVGHNVITMTKLDDSPREIDFAFRNAKSARY